MANPFTTLTRPAPGSDYRAPSPHRKTGLIIGAVGLLLAMVTLIANLVAGGQVEEAGGILAWSFGLTTTGFGTVKFAIGVILVGILVRIHYRWDSMKEALPRIKAAGDGSKLPLGPIDTEFGPAMVTDRAPVSLKIHTMARRMWGPMLGMGAMFVVAGFVVSLVWSTNAGTDPLTATRTAAWTQGLQFLGEGFLLSGISFLLGSILGLIRDGGAEVQESLGLSVKLLDMPATAKAFVGLMMAGLMISITQFGFYVYAAANVTTSNIAANSAWLGPFRELGLGLLLAGIVLALATIGTALAFQAGRVRDIIATGR
jgi:hypothetical protein